MWGFSGDIYELCLWSFICGGSFWEVWDGLEFSLVNMWLMDIVVFICVIYFIKVFFEVF